ncbi:hypothetical protein B0T17DRAFT_64007 [Bombardia bombarda]|uniref:Uncharacterized protein n=1 Tax=Bombardia bombarda TaxID=252184 RepID=A0AA40CEW8_9PEZI|nr:hypothetical protein B0T17DRAFT_64007 [Bombardia bombarda]
MVPRYDRVPRGVGQYRKSWRTPCIYPQDQAVSGVPISRPSRQLPLGCQIHGSSPLNPAARRPPSKSVPTSTEILHVRTVQSLEVPTYQGYALPLARLPRLHLPAMSVGGRKERNPTKPPSENLRDDDDMIIPGNRNSPNPRAERVLKSLNFA